jgi:tetratricopeptide (TPR) repeat protein
MKKHFLLATACVLLSSAAPRVLAAPAKDAAKPQVKKKTPAQIKQEKLDALWKQSDKAFHDGDYKTAIGFHRQIVALDPSDVESYSVAAWLIWSLGDGRAATEHLFKGVKANPKSAAAWNALGENYDLQQHPRPAMKSYAQALKLSPAKANTELLRRRLAHAARRAGDLPTSIATWQSLVRDYPSEVNKRNLKRVQDQQSGAKADS